MEPSVTIGDWVTNCPVCGGPLIQENAKGHVFKTCQSDPTHYFFVDRRIVYNQKGGKMYKLGVILLVLSAMTLATVIFFHVSAGWLLIPTGALAIWLVARIIIEEKK